VLTLAAQDTLRRYGNADDIPAQHVLEKRDFAATVVKVIDGDTVRVRHRRFPFSSGALSSGKNRKKLSVETISVRLAAVDAPETAKFGNAGQPFAQEASDFVAAKVFGQKVRVKILSKDQYGRVVGTVSFREGFLKLSSSDLSMRLLEEGLATMYKGGGAQYDGRKIVYQTTEANAKRRGKGLWSCKKVMESPAEYKRKIKAVAQARSSV
jgi:endonuclease YncB( thermonuclease family)